MKWYLDCKRISEQGLNSQRKRETSAKLKDLQNVIRDKWHVVDYQTVRTAIVVERMFIISGKAE